MNKIVHHYLLLHLFVDIFNLKVVPLNPLQTPVSISKNYLPKVNNCFSITT